MQNDVDLISRAQYCILAPFENKPPPLFDLQVLAQVFLPRL